MVFNDGWNDNVFKKDDETVLKYYQTLNKYGTKFSSDSECSSIPDFWSDIKSSKNWIRSDCE